MEITKDEKEILFEHIEEMTKRLVAINRHLMFYSIILIFAIIGQIINFIFSL